MPTPYDLPFTRTTCAGCGAIVEGLNNRFSCTVCGWVNRWDDSTSPLPCAEDDPDCPRRGRGSTAPARPGPARGGPASSEQ
ncbi:hypothetical protein AB0C59_11750 [Streptomyces sp. NPDC048664]|uniref:hypothetical protein n=1 Tax=Streptomyces sp. NPDC048664 TaxID=3154505 RepID=UPI003439D374